VTACPVCFGPVFQGMKFCPGCGAAIARKPARSAAKLTCPRCGRKMSPARIGETDITECSSCGGIWLDTETFQKICSDREKQEKVLIYPSPVQAAELPPLQSGRMYIPCPVCGGLMQRKNFVGCSGIIVDWCKQHGTWFDRRELQQVVDFILSGGLQKSRQIELDQLKEEQERLKAQQFDLEMASLQSLDPLSFYPDPADQKVSLLDVIYDLCKKIF